LEVLLCLESRRALPVSLPFSLRLASLASLQYLPALVQRMLADVRVEYNLPGVVQCQVNTEVGLTFAQILRANLRQDPDVLMVGEIRDGETAEIAVMAALTGHMVLSTLHTNDAPSTVMRLVDMGIDSMYVGTAVLIVVAQRLIRRICADCKEEYNPTDDELVRLQVNRADLEGIKLYRGRGCDKCRSSGYKGRVALYEIMVNDDVIQDKIFSGADLNELTDTAVAQGMMTLRQLAIYKWKKGVTTLEEVIRLTVSD
jgi:type IV pilus assembly protein PilB